MRDRPNPSAPHHDTTPAAAIALTIGWILAATARRLAILRTLFVRGIRPNTHPSKAQPIETLSKTH